jgi:hypothetical protein
MTNSGEHKISFGTDGNPEGDNPSPADDESHYQRLLREHGTTEDEVDRIANEKYYGDYRRTYRYLRIPQEEVDNLPAEPSLESLVEATGYESDVTPTGDYVELDRRARRLSAALDKFLKYTQARGVDKAMHSPRKNEIRRQLGDRRISEIIQEMPGLLDEGNAEFHKGFGPSDDEFDEQMQANKFFRSFTGPESEEDRTKFRENIYRPRK